MAKKRPKPETRPFVLDGSTALAWYFADEADAFADAVAAGFPDVTAVVPSIWPLEVPNAVVMGERRKRSTEAHASRWLSYLASLPIVVDDEGTTRAWSDVLRLARAHNLSAYDAAYLELALRRGLRLATLDEKLREAAASVGVRLYDPA